MSRLTWWCAVLCMCATATAWAHKPSDSYLTLTAHDAGLVDIHWDVALRDLDGELSLDANDDGRLTWGEIRARWSDLFAYVQAHLRLSHAGQDCVRAAPEPPSPGLIAHTDGQYAVFRWRVHCPLTAGQDWVGLDVDYRLFALTDPTHRGVVRLRAQAAMDDAPRELTAVVLGGGTPSHHASWAGLQGLSAAASPASVPATSMPATLASMSMPQAPARASRESDSRLTQVLHFGREGVGHIASGLDHMLFLLSLLLVSVWRRQGSVAWRSPMSAWQARGHWRSALGEVLRLVTAFTLAHSLTLALAAWGVLSPPSRWVESLIALSVLIAALDNIWPLLRGPRWVVVFGFGLVHGFGFAGAMQDLGLTRQDLAWPLLGFNLGVELGQLLLVAMVLPLAFWFRRSAVYRRVIVMPGSMAIAVLAALWLFERAADVSLGWLPG